VETKGRKKKLHHSKFLARYSKFNAVNKVELLIFYTEKDKI